MGRPKKIIESGGLGTTVKNIIHSTGLDKLAPKDCDGCKNREKALNDLFPRRFKAREVTEEECITWKQFQANRSLKTLTGEQVKYVTHLYASVFNRTVFNCPNCSPRIIIKQIDMLDLVFN